MQGIANFVAILLMALLVIVLIVKSIAGNAMRQGKMRSRESKPGTGDLGRKDLPGQELSDAPHMSMPRPFAKCVMEIPGSPDRQLVVIDDMLVLVSPDRTKTRSFARMPGRVVDSMQVICQDSRIWGYCLTLHDMSAHSYTLECHEVAGNQIECAMLRHCFSLKTDKARLAHAFVTPNKTIGKVALIDKDGSQLELFDIKNKTSDVVDFDSPLIVDHNSSDDGTFFTYDGSALDRWSVDEEHALVLTSKIDAPHGLEGAFFRQGRFNGSREPRPALCTREGVIFTDNCQRLELRNIEHALANMFFTTSDSLWAFVDGQLSKVSAEPLVPIMFQDCSGPDEVSAYATFTNTAKDTAFVFSVDRGVVKPANIVRMKGRILDCTVYGSVCHVFSTAETCIEEIHQDCGRPGNA